MSTFNKTAQVDTNRATYWHHTSWCLENEHTVISITCKDTDICLVSKQWISFRGGSRISQGRVSNPSERGTAGRAPKAPRAARSGEGVVPPPQKIFVFLVSKRCNFYASPVIFNDTVTFIVFTASMRWRAVSYQRRFLTTQTKRDAHVCVLLSHTISELEAKTQ